MFDSNQMTPCGKTYAQIDAEQADYVRAANEALTSMRGKGARWWLYSVSHCTFELLVGEPNGKDNLVLCLAACDYIAGPIGWAEQRLEVLWNCDRENSDKAWEFILQDISVAFRIVAGIFAWRQNFDLLENRSMYFGPEPSGRFRN